MRQALRLLRLQPVCSVASWKPRPAVGDWTIERLSFPSEVRTRWRALKKDTWMPASTGAAAEGYYLPLGEILRRAREAW